MNRLGAAMDIRFSLPVEEFMKHVTDLGLNHVELKREYLHGHPAAPDPGLVRDLAETFGVSVTYHAPFRDWNMGSFNDASRAASVEQVKQTLDDAAVAGAGAVIVHGGSVPRRYPERVRAKATENARQSLRECAAHAREVGVPICLENQPRSAEKKRHTTSPDDLAAMLSAADAGLEVLSVTLDVGHAKVNGHNWREFAERFGDRIRVLHLSDNDGTADDHEPIPDYEPIVDAVGADYNVFEMKSVDDIGRCLNPAEQAGSAVDR